VVDKVALGRFSPSTSVSPAKYHSTIAPYSHWLETETESKEKKKSNLLQGEQT
jgi:hypothetical protein